MRIVRTAIPFLLVALRAAHPDTLVDGAGASRVFHVAPSQTVAISGITVRNGADQAGGGIFAQGNLTLNDVVVTGNSAMGAGGGGIRGGGALTLTLSVVAGNMCSDQ